VLALYQDLQVAPVERYPRTTIIQTSGALLALGSLRAYVSLESTLIDDTHHEIAIDVVHASGILGMFLNGHDVGGYDFDNRGYLDRRVGVQRLREVRDDAVLLRRGTFEVSAALVETPLEWQVRVEVAATALVALTLKNGDDSGIIASTNGRGKVRAR
jgi:hypothetical protein